MANTLKYAQITLHGKRNHEPTQNFAEWLRSVGVLFQLLDHEDPTENIAAVRTWFRDDEGNDATFNVPVLTFNRVLWEDPQGDEDPYTQTLFATGYADLPADFVQKAEKVA